MELKVEYDGNPIDLLAKLDGAGQAKGVWSHQKLKRWNEDGCVAVLGDRLLVKIGPASIDLSNDGFIRRSRWWWRNPLMRWIAWRIIPARLLDIKKTENVGLFWTENKQFDVATIWPGEFVLMSTAEYVSIPHDAFGIVRARSTAGRIGLECMDSGVIDPGFRGQITLELFNPAPWPIPVASFSSHVQLIMFDLDEATERPYAGRYQEQAGITTAKEEKR